jgi:hypothetical protein
MQSYLSYELAMEDELLTSVMGEERDTSQRESGGH